MVGLRRSNSQAKEVKQKATSGKSTLTYLSNLEELWRYHPRSIPDLQARDAGERQRALFKSERDSSDPLRDQSVMHLPFS